MKKIDFVNGTTIDGAQTFNDMQDNVEEVFNGVEPMGSIVVEDIVSKNFFNPYSKNKEYYTNISISYNLLRLTTKLGQGAYNYVDFEVDYQKLLGKEITLSGNWQSSGNATGRFGLHWMDDNYNVIGDWIVISPSGTSGSEELTTTLPSSLPTGATKLCLCPYSNAGGICSAGEYVDYYDVQIEIGSKTDYTPYKKFGYNSQESMGKIVVDDIKCKNMLDIKNYSLDTARTRVDAVSNDTIIVSATSWWAALQYIFTDIQKNTDYTLSYVMDYTKEDFNGALYIYGGSNQYITGGKGKGQQTVTFNSGDYDSITVNFVVSTEFLDNTSTISNIQLEKGSATPYTPYKNFEGKVDIITGQECPTNEYIDGNRVYVKRINHGALNVTTGYTFVSTEIPANNVKIVRTYVSAVNSTDANQLIILPSYLNANEYCHTNTLVIDNVIHYVYSGTEGALAGFELITETYYIKPSTSSVSTTSLEEIMEETE